MCYILPPFDTEAPWGGGGGHVVWRTLACAKCVCCVAVVQCGLHWLLRSLDLFRKVRCTQVMLSVLSLGSHLVHCDL